jgi:hypothetical protein
MGFAEAAGRTRTELPLRRPGGTYRATWVLAVLAVLVVPVVPVWAFAAGMGVCGVVGAGMGVCGVACGVASLESSSSMGRQPRTTRKLAIFLALVIL